MKKVMLLALIGLSSCKASNQLYKHMPSSKKVNRSMRNTNWQYIMPKVNIHNTYSIK